MTLNRCAAVALLAFSAVVAGCGGDGGDGGGETAATNTYWPMQVGNRWVQDDGSDGTIIGDTTVAGQKWFILRDSSSGSPEDSLFQSDSSGVRFYSPTSTVFPAYTSTLLRTPAAVGDRFEAQRLTAPFADVDGNGTVDDIDFRTEAQVIGFDTVTTPAGTFTEALHVRFTITGEYVFRPSGTRQTYSTGAADYWYAPGVGPVRFSGTTTTNGETESFSSQLTGYRVGTRTGGTLPAR